MLGLTGAQLVLVLTFGSPDAPLVKNPSLNMRGMKPRVELPTFEVKVMGSTSLYGAFSVQSI